jgi:hypothetical protein
VDAAHKLDNTRRVQSSGAGSNSDMRDRPVFFDVKKYSADFTHRWDLQQEEEEWKFILERLMVKKTVCLACHDVIGSSPGLATTEEVDEHLRTHRTTTTEEFDEHLRTHPLQEGELSRYKVDELRCAVCDEADTNHILECEFTPEDRKHNECCREEELFKQAGIQPRKMSEMDKAHRSAVKRVRAGLRSTVNAIQKAVQTTGHILMVDKKYREFLKPTATVPGAREELKPATSSKEREAREDPPGEEPDTSVTSAEMPCK